MLWEDRVDLVASEVTVIELVKWVGLPVIGDIWEGWGSLEFHGRDGHYGGNNGDEEFHVRLLLIIIF